MGYNKWTRRVWLSCTSIHTQYNHYTTNAHIHTHIHMWQYLITETSQQGIQYSIYQSTKNIIIKYQKNDNDNIIIIIQPLTDRLG